MTARIMQITRPQERLMSAREVADRLGIGYESALALVKRRGVCPTGKARGHWYITETELHRALMRAQ